MNNDQLIFAGFFTILSIFFVYKTIKYLSRGKRMRWRGGVEMSFFSMILFFVLFLMTAVTLLFIELERITAGIFLILFLSALFDHYKAHLGKLAAWAKAKNKEIFRKPSAKIPSRKLPKKEKFEIYDNGTGEKLCSLSWTQLNYLMSMYETWNLETNDFNISQETIDLLVEDMADPELVSLLKTCLGDREEIDIRWVLK